MVLVIGVPRFASRFSWNLVVDCWSVRTTGKKGQKGERVALNQKGQIQPKNSATTACLLLEKRVLAFDRRSKAKQKEEQWWEEPGNQSLYFSKAWIWASNIW